MPEIGQTIYHYRIIEKLGQGGMGEVFLVHDTSLDRKVALKFLPDIFSGDPERLARFNRMNVRGVAGTKANGDVASRYKKLQWTLPRRRSTSL